jgi:LmbE family N-acetylglucosaminyl deacetylase
LLFASDQPDYWVDIEKTFAQKMKALGLHKSQVSQWPDWQERFRKRAEDAGTSRGLKLAEPFKRLVLS